MRRRRRRRAEWILGGWGNKQHGIQTHFAEQDQLLERVPADRGEPMVRCEDRDDRRKMDCYLDGKFMQSAEVLHHRVPTMFTSATRDDKTGETILKVVNPGKEAAAATVLLQGGPHVQAGGLTIVLTGNPADDNTFRKT